MWRLVVLLSVLCWSRAAHKPASAYFNICHRGDPEYQQCVLSSVIKSLPALVRGIPELDIVPIDPLRIERMEHHEQAGAFKLHTVNTNVTMHGLSRTQILGLSMDLDALSLHVNASIPYMRFTCDYQIDGKILLLPIRGKGDAEFNFTDVYTSGLMQGRLEERAGQVYLQIQRIDWDTDVRDTKVHLNNLFNGDKLLGDAANKMFNDNWRDIFLAYKNIVEESFGILFKDLANKVFRKFTFKELYPE